MYYQLEDDPLQKFLSEVVDHWEPVMRCVFEDL